MWWENKELAAKAAQIQLVAFDVDGVCTDGRLYYGDDGEALHAFHARDGMGLVLARQQGLPTAAISGRRSGHVQSRLSELKVPHILQGIQDKPAHLENLKAQYGCEWQHVAYVGDDVNDIGLLQKLGWAPPSPMPPTGLRIAPTFHCKRSVVEALCVNCSKVFYGSRPNGPINYQKAKTAGCVVPIGR